MRIILKAFLWFLLGFAGYSLISVFSSPYIHRIIIGLLAVAIYFTAIKLRAINEEYAARVRNGIKWMNVSILLGLLPYVMYFLVYASIHFGVFPSGFFGIWSYRDLDSFLDKYPFLLGPFVGLLNVMEILFPRDLLYMLFSMSLLLVVPLVIGFFIYKKRRHSYENTNISAKS